MSKSERIHIGIVKINKSFFAQDNSRFYDNYILDHFQFRLDNIEAEIQMCKKLIHASIMLEA